MWACDELCDIKGIGGLYYGKGEALGAGHYLISLLALKFVLLCLKLVVVEDILQTCCKSKPILRGGTYS